MVKTKNLTLIVTAAVLAALTCVATMVVQIPMPLTKGYVNFGDVLVLTSAWLLGSPWGIAAASSIFGNVIQGAVGLIVGVLLTVALEKARVKKMLGFDK